MQHHARTFSAAAALLAPAARDEIAAVYTFCRTIDDLADDHADDDGLARIADELAGRLEPGPLSNTILALAPRGVPVDAAEHLVQGVRSDLAEVRLADPDALVRYGYLVAGTVGRLVCPLLGVHDPHAIPFAVDLGVAMQLSNIARDVGEDAGKGRVYLPAAWLAEAGLGAADVLALADDSASVDVRARIAQVVSRVVDLADRYYASADAGFRYLPLRARVAVALAARRYRGIGHRVRRLGAPALTVRTVLPPWSRLGWFAAAPWIALFAPLSAEPTHDASLHEPLRAWLTPDTSAQRAWARR